MVSFVEDRLHFVVNLDMEQRIDGKFSQTRALRVGVGT